MNNIDLRPGISTLLNSWGSDTPPEVYWGLNKLVEILAKNTNATPIYAEEDGFNSEEEETSFLNQFIL